MSIGGIAGYTIAMRYYRVNQIKEAASMYLVEVGKSETLGHYSACTKNSKCLDETPWEYFFPDTPLPKGVQDIRVDIQVPMPWCFNGKRINSLEAWIKFEETPEGTQFCNFFCNSYGSPSNEDQTGLNFGQETCWNQCDDYSGAKDSYSACIYVPTGLAGNGICP